MKKVLLRHTGGTFLDKKAAAREATEASLQASRRRANDSWRADMTKVNEELAMLPEAAGIRAVCDMYAGMRDKEEVLKAKANGPGASVVW